MTQEEASKEVNYMAPTQTAKGITKEGIQVIIRGQFLSEPGSRLEVPSWEQLQQGSRRFLQSRP